MCSDFLSNQPSAVPTPLEIPSLYEVSCALNLEVNHMRLATGKQAVALLLFQDNSQSIGSRIIS